MTEFNMIFRQLFDSESWTYTYLLADPETGELKCNSHCLWEEMQ